MIKSVHPKLPMRNKAKTLLFYSEKLNFIESGSHDYDFYLIIQSCNLEIHFFEHKSLVPSENYGQIFIRTQKIQELYKNYLKKKVEIHPNGALELKPWGQWEFSILDPDNNLLTFGESS